MKLLFNTFITKVIPCLPLFMIRSIAGRYVAGETTQDALRIVKDLNGKGFCVTLDILGEHTKDENMAEEITNDYHNLILAIHKQNLDCNLSIKPSHIGLDINSECIDTNMSKLINTAKNYDNFIRIDMEDSSATDKTISLFHHFNNNNNNLGIVLQAYLIRTENDFESLKNIENLNIRLCKGIYREPSTVAIQDRKMINQNFMKLLRIAFENNIYVGIATHDLSLIKESLDLINKLQISSDRFEFQVLFGVPMSGWLETHLENNYRVRIYVPFGKDWYDYSIRRLKENPSIAGYIIQNYFRK